MQKFLTLLSLLKYGIVLSLLLMFLPLTAFCKDLPGHNFIANMFVELPARGVLIATMFLLAVVWSIMFTEGLIVNGSENRFDQSQLLYRSHRQIQSQPMPRLPHWADVFFSVPVTPLQFVLFTLFLAGPSLMVFIVKAQSLILALLMAVVGFLIDYALLIFFCTPAALLDPNDPPLKSFPLAESIWSRFGFAPVGISNVAQKAAMSATRRAHRFFSWMVKKLHLFYLLDPQTGLAYPIHFLAASIVVFLMVLWIVFDWAAYPGGIFHLESAPVVYVYASLLLLVWLFAALNFHLGRLHISSLAALLIFVFIGYGIFGIDHEYQVTRETSQLPRLTPVDVVERSKGGSNLVVVTSAGGGIWASGWTALALEKLITARPQLVHEIRLLSTVSGGSVGAAHYLYGLLNDEQFQQKGELTPNTLRNIRVKAMSSSLEATAYGIAFRDFPRFVTGGIYHPTLDRGDFLEHEWARIASGKVRKEYIVAKGNTEAGKCWGRSNKCSFLDLREAISAGLIPSIIFNATIMELGRKVMITPLDFEHNGKGHKRGETLAEFLFTDPTTSTSVQANFSLWTAARLSATFSFVSPAVRTNVSNKGKGEVRNVWQKHIVDGGYYDNFGVASMLDWLQAVLEARRDGKQGLNFSRVLIIQLRGFAEKPGEARKASPGAQAALIGPFATLFAIREGVAVSRNIIDVDRFMNYWNRELAGKVTLESVDFVPDIKDVAGPLSWHLSNGDIKNLQDSWGDSDKPASWKPGILKSWCTLARFLAHDIGAECPAS